MPFYECVFIARQDITAPQAEGLADQFTSVIEERGGKVPRREYWGLRSLAYRIRKNRKGHYILLNIDAPAEALHEMERQIGINEDVLRHLSVRVESLSDEPSAVMQSRAVRGDDMRGRRDRADRSDRGRSHGDDRREERGGGRWDGGRGDGGRGDGSTQEQEAPNHTNDGPGED